MKHAGVQKGDTVVNVCRSGAVSVFTSDEGRRGGRILPLKSTVDTAIQNLNFVRNVCVFKRTHNTVVQMNPQVDVDMEEDMSHHRLYGPAEYVNAENLMFILYTSSSTGAPKGIDHTLAAT
ncbi:acetyl-coenzyme A synthetase [Phytophthora infestans T30-4]|uniref:Acetyl-coenzyme A synthetase n=1 Tax=Phytophthora infestans (strain T30-4) TaxID=403677 RepID=D0NWW8_PHYIT|nr:acetyl-coenzyme A synthetase [Phytophthora infestans T30-4]EEY67555.1 acetyl-coenzyme A synthetase [Phytophthora infestans T30-4]|eukprot:XP_002896414.1 acetyl-coenzyme A synthetase [Phytophthora infestans T30-4]